MMLAILLPALVPSSVNPNPETGNRAGIRNNDVSAAGHNAAGAASVINPL